MDYIGPIFFIMFAALYLLGCFVFAFFLWLLYKFVLKIEEKPRFWTLYKISFSSGFIAGALGYVLFEIAAAAAILGTATGQGADMALLSVMTQILSYPKTTAALYLVVILAISALLAYVGIYLAHRYHAKSTPKQIASKLSLIIAAAFLLIQGAYFTYAWIAVSRGMEAAYSQLSPEEVAAARATRECAVQMQRALTLPEDEQLAAIAAASNCMTEAGELVPPNTIDQPTASPLSTLSSERDFSPSFDCDKVTSNVNKLICSDRELSFLDVTLNETYDAVLSNEDDPTSLRVSQKEWLRSMLNKCSDKNCIRDAYQERIGSLQYDYTM
jgi:uncharacterized protein YecT (DUF1311 family)